MRTLMNWPFPVLVAAVLFGGPSCKKSPPTPATASTRILHIAALNDFHGSLYEKPARDDPATAYGGLPWLASAVTTLRTEHPDLLLLDGGDIFQGSWPVNATQGRGAVEAYNLIGVDAAAVGNHEFDYGGIPGEHPLRGALEAGGRLAHYEWLTANISDTNGLWEPPGFAPWVILERSGIKVGIIGLSTQDTPQTTIKKNVADLSFADVVQTVRELAPQLREQGAEVVIAIGHLTGACEPTSYTEIGPDCSPDGEVGRLLTELPLGTLDVLIAGHAHTLLHHRVGNTFVLEQRAMGHALGRLDLVVGKGGVDPDASTLHRPWFLSHPPVDPGCEDVPFPVRPIEVGGRTLSPDPLALSLIERLEEEAGSLCDPVGCSTETLHRDRAHQSEVGDLVSDAMLAAFPSADIAITNSGGLRSDIQKGTVRREDMQAVMPFNNRLVLIEMTGAQLQHALQIGSSGAHGVLQVSGGTYSFDPAHTGGEDQDGDGNISDWETARLCGASVHGQPINPSSTYRVVTTDFLYTGGDHLGPAFADTTIKEEGPLLRDQLYTWFEAQKECYRPPKVQRITEGHCDGSHGGSAP